jgi:hypothetical protein
MTRTPQKLIDLQHYFTALFYTAMKAVSINFGFQHHRNEPSDFPRLISPETILEVNGSSFVFALVTFLFWQLSWYEKKKDDRLTTMMHSQHHPVFFLIFPHYLFPSVIFQSKH